MQKVSSEKLVQDIRRKTRKKYSSEEKICIVLEGMRGEENISELCRREGIASNLYYRWSKDFLEAGKKRLMGDTAREANTQEVREPHCHNFSGKSRGPRKVLGCKANSTKHILPSPALHYKPVYPLPSPKYDNPVRTCIGFKKKWARPDRPNTLTIK